MYEVVIMPRAARAKSPESIYHIVCRSISEFNLFRDDDDKNYYLDVLVKYCDKFHCKVLAYCLMDTHLHLQFDPQGFDVSRFMHCVNLSYASYYNRKYERHGHVFQGRFESKIIASDKYCLAVSAYIHNNPKDVEGYRDREHEYPFSSMGIYLGMRRDHRGLVDTDFILELFNTPDKQTAVRRYAEFVEGRKKGAALGDGIEKCLGRLVVNVYRSERRVILRDIKPERIMDMVARTLGITLKEGIHIKYGRAFEGFRTYTAFVLRVLGGLSYREICGLMGNISLSGAAELCRRGYNLLLEGGVYRGIFDRLLSLSPAI
jgi:putative transposase